MEQLHFEKSGSGRLTGREPVNDGSEVCRTQIQAAVS